MGSEDESDALFADVQPPKFVIGGSYQVKDATGGWWNATVQATNDNGTHAVVVDTGTNNAPVEWHAVHPDNMRPHRREVRKTKTHGLQCPWTLHQKAGVGLASVDFVLFLAFKVPYMEGPFETTLTFMWFSLYLIMVVCWLAVEFSDPVDAGGDVECLVCRKASHKTSKHCYECNKCVDSFDHHCPLLNTCIGGANYRRYLSLIWTATAVQGLLITTCIVFAVNDASSLEPSVPWIVLYIAIALMHLPVLGSAAWLVGFHVLIIFQNKTTYQYWTGKSPCPPGVRPIVPTAAPQKRAVRKRGGVSRSLSYALFGMHEPAEAHEQDRQREHLLHLPADAQ